MTRDASTGRPASKLRAGMRCVHASARAQLRCRGDALFGPRVIRFRRWTRSRRVASFSVQNRWVADQPAFELGVMAGVAQVEVGGKHVCVVDERTRELSCAPTFDFGEHLLERLDVGAEVGSLALGHSHGCMVSEDGSTRCFGGNGWGQLGLGHSQPYAEVAVHLPGVTTSVRVSEHASCAADRDGEIRCWGRWGRGRGDRRRRQHQLCRTQRPQRALLGHSPPQRVRWRSRWHRRRCDPHADHARARRSAVATPDVPRSPRCSAVASSVVRQTIGTATRPCSALLLLR
jgi:hypothetical protein